MKQIGCLLAVFLIGSLHGRAQNPTEIERYSVTEKREAPFAGRNVDLARTADDVQPYVIFAQEQIGRSAAINLEEFLKDRLSMNTVAQTNAQFAATSPTPNTASTINLRGLGADKTLILVNGRRLAGLNRVGAYLQSDLNSIPLAAVDRIEVLPTSASAIYGGSAIGGVVNVILRKNYAGSELRVTYANTFMSDAPERRAEFFTGAVTKDGRTHVMIDGQRSDVAPLYLADRPSLYERGLRRVLQVAPSTFYSAATPFLGATPNITAAMSVQSLTLKSGATLGARTTFVPVGLSNSASPNDRDAALRANAGIWSFDLPRATQAPTGLLRPLSAYPQTDSFEITVDREFDPGIRVFTEYSWRSNHSRSVSNPFNAPWMIPASAPANPFTTAVSVTVPFAAEVPATTDVTTGSWVLGAAMPLRGDWIAEAEYAWSASRLALRYFNADMPARDAAVLRGALNPFVDSLRFPLALENYLYPASYANESTTNELAARAAGSVPWFSWAESRVSFGAEQRRAGFSDNTLENAYAITTTNSDRTTYFGRKQEIESAYGELLLPLVRRHGFPGVRALDLQAAGRIGRTEVDYGTPFVRVLYGMTPPVVTYGSPTLNGAPFRSEAHYTTGNETIGLKYEPLAGVVLRGSVASAFLPPTPDQLVRNPTPNATPTTITDPTTGTRYAVTTTPGGNPSLHPQSSRSLNLGAIWEAVSTRETSVRFDVEYYEIVQRDAIGGLSAQQIVNAEQTYADRITRESGRITAVDVSLMNLYRRETRGWDVQISARRRTSLGEFEFNAQASVITRLRNQLALGQPSLDYAGYVAEGGAAKNKGSASLVWSRGGVAVGWTTRYFGSYKQYGAAGSPFSRQFLNGAASSQYLAAQGADAIAAQTFHDVFASFDFAEKNGAGARRRLSDLFRGTEFRIGVRNVFNTPPAFDAFYDSNYYLSPYGDARLRSYWISLRKRF